MLLPLFRTKPAYRFLFTAILITAFSSSCAYAQQTLFKLLPPLATGIKFSNDIIETESLNVLSYEYLYNGAGVAVGDINNDGLKDLIFTGNMRPNKLYLNLGGMKFRDITTRASPEMAGRPNSWKTGVTMADVNGDGLLDIYICYSGRAEKNSTRSNQLFINQGNNKFKEEAKAYGLADEGYSTQAAFFDYDGDGDLDMFLLNHNIKKIDNMELARYKNETDQLASNKLFKNNGGHFTDVSKNTGIVQNPLTFGLGVAIADINNDGWPDIYVTNDYNEPDYIYINTHDGKFTERSKDMIRHMSHFSMGVDIADFNNDGLADILSLDMIPEDNHRQKSLQLEENYESFALMQNQGLYKQYMRNMMHVNNGDGTFSEIGQLAGISNTDWSWCPLIADLDNDGYKDIFISNGYLRDYTNKDFLRYWGDYKIKKAIAREPFLLMDLVKAMPSTAVPNYVYKNNHNLTFSNKQAEWGINQPGVSSGAIYADLDNDGDLDLVVNNINAPASVYQNTSREVDHTNYLAIKLKETDKNTNAVGAKVFVYSGNNMQYQEQNPNKGYLSCVSTTLNFGLGNQNTVDSVKVIWPDRTSQLLTSIRINQLLSIDKKPSDNSFQPAVLPANPIFTKTKPAIDFTPEPIPINDFKRQLLMLFMYSNTAPVIINANVNTDGLEDLFISGTPNSPGRLYMQQAGGKYNAVDLVRGATDNIGTISAAAFFDANGDKKPDLYIAKGGYDLYEPNTPDLQDELYINEGDGRFVLSPAALPAVNANSKSCVRAADFDNDGDVDIFVGGRIIPGQYPVAPQSYLLVNDGTGKFTSLNNIAFDKIGMVTDAQWVDFNGDKRKDLVICGEFMPITVLINTPAGFEDKTPDYFETPQTGFWFSLVVTDVNADGKPDLVVGNLGTNTQIHVSEQEPAALYFDDFDKNGSIDPFLNFYIQGKSYPFVSRDELNDQIYSMRRKFSSYKLYADATINDIFSADELKKAKKLTVTQATTNLYINNNNKFVKMDLPIQAQFAPVTQIIVDDFDKDGKTDLLLLGNRSNNRLKLGSMDANYGCLLKGNGTGDFTYVSQPASGLSVDGDVKSALQIDINGTSYLLIGTSNGPLQFYKK